MLYGKVTTYLLMGLIIVDEDIKVKKTCWELANERRELRQAKALRKRQSAKNKKVATRLRNKAWRKANRIYMIERDLQKSIDQNIKELVIPIEESDIWNNVMD